MTCIVGIVGKDGRVHLGGDSAGVAGYSITVRADEKVFKKGEFIMGFTSSFRMGQLLRYKLDIPYHKPNVDTYEYMVTEFVESLRKCLKEGGFSKNDSGEESGGTFLVGYKGDLFYVGDDFQVGRYSLSYGAVGCGQEIANGSLYSNIDKEPIERIKESLMAAQQFSGGVREPFVIVSTDTE
ncbi:hypothetical protein ACM26V_00380 [Salipaludibacillus sp. HK11]|uniref:hypothetical protein n=1 Tax=Salipaludibacillus sp. HK11 TaxID=3394320 RepID=UPI0039FC07F5